MKLDLQYFSGGHSVTLYKDGGVTTFTASSSSDVQKDAEVTLTVVLASGYHVKEYNVLAGGVTVNPETKKFTMGEANVVIALTTTADSLYKVIENTEVNINGTKTELIRNMVIEYGPNGAITGVKSDGTTISLDGEIIKQLVAAGIIVQM